jgi:hypothetical protein
VVDIEQFVIDLPEVRAFVQRIVTQRGYCGHCRRKVRSRHPAQVSDAVGAAAISLGPRALALAADLKHRMPARGRGQARPASGLPARILSARPPPRRAPARGRGKARRSHRLGARPLADEDMLGDATPS